MHVVKKRTGNGNELREMPDKLENGTRPGQSTGTLCEGGACRETRSNMLRRSLKVILMHKIWSLCYDPGTKNFR